MIKIETTYCHQKVGVQDKLAKVVDAIQYSRLRPILSNQLSNRKI